MSLVERFEAKVDRSAGPDGCHLWTGGCSGVGYGVIKVAGRVLYVHRVAWELAVGAIPDGHEVDHVKARGCESLLCVNIAHLEPVTKRENLRRQGEAITHCVRGHSLAEEAGRRLNGRRYCRRCARDRMRARRTAA